MKKIRTFFLILLSVMLCVTMAFPSFADDPSEWARAEITEAIALGLVPHELQNRYTVPITRAEFAKSIIYTCAAHEKMSTSDFAKAHKVNGTPHFDDLTSETEEYSVYAYEVGVVKGKSDSRFDPDSPITREEAAVMLYRAYLLCGGSFVNGTGVTFADREEISLWAVIETEAVASAGIMKGVGDGKFSPRGTYTREQCYLTLLRLYSALPDGTEHKEIITTKYFEYSINEKGDAEVLKYIGEDGIVVMQSEIYGHAVTTILAGALNGRDNVQLCVRDSVTKIENGAFPANMKAVYYESENGAVKEYAEEHGLNCAPWVWKDIAYLGWRRVDDGLPVFTPVHGDSMNYDIIWDATTMIWCEWSPEEKFEYTIENGEVTVWDYKCEDRGGINEYVSIPEYIEGYPVRTIGKFAFDGRGFKHLEIPGTVHLIDCYACYSSNTVETVHVLDGDDCILGIDTFTGLHDHVRLHNNIVGRKYCETDDDPRANPVHRSGMGLITPYNFEEKNGYVITLFMYHAE